MNLLRCAGPFALALLWGVAFAHGQEKSPAMQLSYETPHWLIISGDHLPGEKIRINYLEAYCRAGSTDADWVKHTVIPHRPELLEVSADGSLVRLRDRLEDGVIVDHTIRSTDDEISFAISAKNPTDERSEAHWAQPCIRLGAFTGFSDGGSNLDDYLPKGFVFIDGELTRFPQVVPWAKEARYIPGQVWCPTSVPRTDVNPRPLSPLVPTYGLIGCYSADERMVFGVAFEPYQELFQGVARCLHSDFRLGGLKPGESKQIRGKIYLIRGDGDDLLKRYLRDFPEHGNR